MKFTVFYVVLLAAAAAARPDKVMDIDLEDIHHDQDVDHRHNAFLGTYSWISPEGLEYFVSYVADEDGFRIVDTNAVPVSPAGVRADGMQGAFVSSEELTDDDDDDDDDDLRTLPIDQLKEQQDSSPILLFSDPETVSFEIFK